MLVDIDPQGSCSIGVEAYNNPDGSTLSISDLLTCEKTSLEDVIQKPQKKQGAQKSCPLIDIIPADNSLALAEMKMSLSGAKEFKLRKKLLKSGLNYDFVFIDCPPTFGTLSINAFVASDYIIMPLMLGYFTLRGVNNFIETLSYVNKEISYVINHETQILGVLFNFYDLRANISKSISQSIKRSLGDLIFNTTIPVNVKLNEAQSNHVPIFDYDNSCPGAKAYENLCCEIIERIS